MEVTLSDAGTEFQTVPQGLALLQGMKFLETCHMHQWVLKQGEGLRNVRSNCVFWVKGAVSENLWNPLLETSHEGEQALQNNRQSQKELMKTLCFKLRKKWSDFASLQNIAREDHEFWMENNIAVNEDQKVTPLRRWESMGSPGDNRIPIFGSTTLKY